MNILDTITASTAKRVAESKKSDFPFERALKQSGISFICEVKKASPSKGVIAENFPWLQIAKEYEDAGASAISVLTEPEFFKGKDEYLQNIAKEVRIPVLRKDFTIDEFQIYEAKFLGASAVLLICAILENEKLKSYIELAHSIGLSALVEVHNETETENALNAGARIIGINNRDLKTFNVDLKTTERLCKLIPSGIIKISESGIKTAQDMQFLETCGIDVVLIGESFMLAEDKKRHLEMLMKR
ncbi:MAG: indole-3-glycerol phosphate synthase TrpC [Fibromonadales bacterium]|nr:indole-3-glycerol phosphate synthase TrpC [Fibromonadales bacterium]